MASSPEVREKFVHTDFQRQTAMLADSLELAAGATGGEPASLRDIAARAKSHDRNHLDIRPELYGLWLESLIETARDYDSEWSPEVETTWRHILQHVIDHMVMHYRG